jgi:hypothetical protein
MREHATKKAFVRRSVSKFMPGETVEDAIEAAKVLQPRRINTILTRLGEKHLAHRGSRRSLRALHESDRAREGRRP